MATGGTKIGEDQPWSYANGQRDKVTNKQTDRHTLHNACTSPRGKLKKSATLKKTTNDPLLFVFLIHEYYY